MRVPFPQQARHLAERFGKQPNIEEMITELGSLIQSGQNTPMFGARSRLGLAGQAPQSPLPETEFYQPEK